MLTSSNVIAFFAVLGALALEVFEMMEYGLL